MRGIIGEDPNPSHGFGSSPIIPLMLSLLFFIQWLVNYKKQKNI
jgi:hypothetical protein